MFEVAPWTRRHVASIGLMLVVIVPVLASCGSGATESPITETQVVTRDIRIPDGPDNLPERIGFRSRTPTQAPPAAEAPRYTWTLPKGWSELPPKEFRQGNFKIASAPKVEAYMSILPKAGGGGLANLNRWRQQMGLAAISAADASKLPTIPVLGQGAALVDFEGTFGGMSGGPGGEGYRLVGLLLLDRGYGVFLKMVGPKEDVAKERDNFLKFSRSLKPKGGTPAAEHAHGFDPNRLKWTAPDSWVKGPKRNMREVTYRTAGTLGAECYISVFPGTVGGLVANVNRWRSQAGQEAPLTAAEVEALPRIPVLGMPSSADRSTAGGIPGTQHRVGAGQAIVCERCDSGSFSYRAKRKAQDV